MQSSAPEDGRDHPPKCVELIAVINKSLLLHLVGCLYYLCSKLFNTARIVEKCNHFVTKNLLINWMVRLFVYCLVC